MLWATFLGTGLIALWFVLPGVVALKALCISAIVLLHLVTGVRFLFVNCRWFWRFLRTTLRFHTATSRRIVLRYADELKEVVDADEVSREAEKALADLETAFGRLSLFWHGQTVGPLLFRRRVHVYLFPTCEAGQAVFGKRYAGVALQALHAVVIPSERYRLHEILRHELAHLFSLRWNPWAPPLLAEGLSVWMQATEQGYSIHWTAITLLRRDEYNLRQLLDSAYFFDEGNRWRCYLLAGSFTGFLLGRFGWKVYKRFYCRLHGQRKFDVKFMKTFAFTFEEAERLWQEDLFRRYYGPGKLWHAWFPQPQSTVEGGDQ